MLIQTIFLKSVHKKLDEKEFRGSDFEVFCTVIIGLQQGSIIGPFLLIFIEDDLELLKGTYQVQKFFMCNLKDIIIYFVDTI